MPHYHLSKKTCNSNQTRKRNGFKQYYRKAWDLCLIKKIFQTPIRILLKEKCKLEYGHIMIPSRTKVTSEKAFVNCNESGILWNNWT